MSLPTQLNIASPNPIMSCSPFITFFPNFLHNLCHLLTQLEAHLYISHLPPLEHKFQESKGFCHFADG